MALVPIATGHHGRDALRSGSTLDVRVRRRKGARPWEPCEITPQIDALEDELDGLLARHLAISRAEYSRIPAVARSSRRGSDLDDHLMVRVLRLAGLGLLLFCILKLFVFDLRNLETLARITPCFRTDFAVD